MAVVSHALRHVRHFIGTTLLAGVLLVAPIYLAILLLLKAVKSVEGLVKPLTKLMPTWFAGEAIISVSVVLLFCFLVGITLRTGVGQAARSKIEDSVLQKIPGYEVLRGMTRQLAGEERDSAWKPALVEIEEALVPAFIVEEIGDGRCAVFVPSVPTPLAGSIYILTPERVHPLNVPFTHALKTISRWGSGSKELVAAMEREPAPLVRVK
jgi:uncharacterized membrane protein